MSNINKQELREAAERAESDSWGYDRDEFNEALTPSTVLALLDELKSAENNLIDSECHVAELEESLRDKQALLEDAEERYEDMLRQARSFREAHDSASEIIRKLERNKPTVKLPTTRLWAGKIACYEESEVVAMLERAGINIDAAGKGEAS